jgi:hypothetical protein
MMKKVILGLVVSATLISICGFDSFTKYTREAKVISSFNNEVVVMDSYGHVWSFYGDGFKARDKVKLHMDSLGTNNVTDDIITDAEIIG